MSVNTCAQLLCSSKKTISTLQLVLIVGICLVDIPLWPTFCYEQMNMFFTLNIAYLIVLPVICCDLIWKSILMFTILYANMIVRRHFYSETGIFILDAIFLFILLFTINLILSFTIANTNKQKQTNTDD